ncbi:MAG: thiol-disulfide oxidoreductase DCC family protein [Lishizhenia sp.]
MQKRKKVFYDGDCGFCNKSVRFILKNRRTNNFLFIPLQTEYAKKELERFDIIIDMSTLYVLDNERVREKSDALLSLVNNLKWFWFWLRLGYLLPKKTRNFIYDNIAKRRHKLAKSYCYMPSEVEKEMFFKL